MIPNHVIPGTDLKVSELCLGTGNLGGGISQEESFNILDCYLDSGGYFLDTAKVYSDWLPGERSASEKTIGRWLKSNGKRDQVIVATKGGHPDLATMSISRLSPAEITSDIEASLHHLGVDYIDLYWLHRDDPNRPVDDMLETLVKQTRVGNIRYFGVSNWSLDRIIAGIAYSHKLKMPEIVASQIMWNLAVLEGRTLDPTLAWMNEKTLEFHKDKQLPVIPFSSQANGLFQKIESGKVTQESSSSRSIYPYLPNYQRFLRIKQVATRTGYTVTQVVLAYLLSQPFMVIPIIGPSSIEQLKDSLTAAGCRLDQEHISYLIEGLPI